MGRPSELPPPKKFPSYVTVYLLTKTVFYGYWVTECLEIVSTKFISNSENDKGNIASDEQRFGFADNFLKFKKTSIGHFLKGVMF